MVMLKRTRTLMLVTTVTLDVHHGTVRVLQFTLINTVSAARFQ
jgi:hypothetical protein